MKNFSFWALIIFLSLSMISAQAKAQDGEGEGDMDNPSIVPPINTNQSSQPIIIDESDSESVSEVDEYDN